jgi:PTH1 family peptidyl-tRNA hydrolase
MRIRIGIGHPGLKKDVTNWVLTKFSPNEKKSLAQAYKKFDEVFDMICNNQIDQAQKILHTK